MVDPSVPAFDDTVTRGLAEAFGSEERVARLIELFLSEAPGLVQAVADGIGASRADDVVRPAHTLKSSAAAVGAMRLSAICAQLEALARAQDLGPKTAMLGDMQGAFEEVRALLAAEAHRLA
jgi:HPt (histidine-containing phosphotransfer) domain-containing protein